MNKSYIIGIAGGSASGKTTFARQLTTWFGFQNVLHICLDSYYKNPEEYCAFGEAPNFDHPDAFEFTLLQEHLRLFRSGSPAEIPQYDFVTSRRLLESNVRAPRNIIIVEGILLFAHEALRKEFDLAVFIDAPTDERLRRRTDRDERERGRTRSSVFEQFQTTVRPMHDLFVEPSKKFADLIIHGDERMDKAFKLLAGGLQHLMGPTVAAGASEELLSVYQGYVVKSHAVAKNQGF